MRRRRASLILLSGIFISAAALLLAGCGERAPARPDLPESIAPGWTRQSFESSPPPAGLPSGPAPSCGHARYSIAGTAASADVFVCGYTQESSAFNAVQRARAEANAVKVQAGKILAIVRWSGVSREEITALVRGIQKSLPRP